MNAAAFIAVTLATKENGISCTTLGQEKFPVEKFVSESDWCN